MSIGTGVRITAGFTGLLGFLLLCQALGYAQEPGYPENGTASVGQAAPGLGYPDSPTASVEHPFPATTAVELPSPVTSAVEPGVVTGKVLEMGTRRPIEGASIFLLPVREFAMTEKDGSFVLRADPGEYQLSAVMVDYLKPRPMPVLLSPGGETEVTVYLEQRFYSPLEVIVETKREREVSEQVLEKAEAERVAGTSGDIIRSIQTLPGVTTGGTDMSGALFVRGGSPTENLYIMDLAPVVSIFHFGGFYSTINPDLIEDIRFYAGGFGPKYGFNTGGIIDITTRDGRRDRAGGRVNVSFLMADGQVEGPLGERGSFFISGRRSYVDIFQPLLEGEDYSVYPRFWDYQAKFSYEAGEKNKIGVLLFGSADTLLFSTDMENRNDPVLSGSVDSDIYFHTQIISLRSLISPRLTLKASVYNSVDGARANLNQDIYIDSHFYTPGFRTWLEWDMGEHSRLRAGTDFMYIYFHIDGRVIYLPREEDAVPPNVTFAERIPTQFDQGTYGGGTALEDELSWGGLKVVPGVRMDYVEILDEWNFSPRVRFSYQLPADLKIKGATGLYHQLPSPTEYAEGYGNPEVDSTPVVHYVAGVEKKFGPNVTLDLQGYYKDYNDMIARSDDPAEVYNMEGDGFSTGVEVLLRHQLTRRFFGWLAYSYCISRRKWPGQEEWVPSFYEQPHSLALVMNYQLASKWNAGAKFMYQSGMHYTPLKPGFYDADWDLWYPIPGGELNSATLPDYQRLDIRVERQFLYQTWKMGAYLEIQNVYLHKNVIAMIYNDDWTDPQEVYWIPILPFLGVEAEF